MEVHDFGGPWLRRAPDMRYDVIHPRVDPHTQRNLGKPFYHLVQYLKASPGVFCREGAVFLTLLFRLWEWIHASSLRVRSCACVRAYFFWETLRSVRVLAERGKLALGDTLARTGSVVCVYNGCQKQPGKETREFGIKGNYSFPLCIEFRKAAGLFVSVCRCLLCRQDN